MHLVSWFNSLPPSSHSFKRILKFYLDNTRVSCPAMPWVTLVSLVREWQFKFNPENNIAALMMNWDLWAAAAATIPICRHILGLPVESVVQEEKEREILIRIDVHCNSQSVWDWIIKAIKLGGVPTCLLATTARPWVVNLIKYLLHQPARAGLRHCIVWMAVVGL